MLTDIDLTQDAAAGAFVKDEIVEVVFATDAGVCISREGPNHFAPGDALITAANGDKWSVARDRFDHKYAPIAPCGAGSNGTDQARHIAVLAKPMPMPFSIARRAAGDVLHGQAGDWLLQYAPGDFGVAENARFVRVYRRA